MPTSALAACANCPTPPASAVRMPAITAPTWCSITAALTPDDTNQVVAELVDLARRHRLAEVALHEPNLLVDVHRAVAIAEGLVEANAPFRWTFQASTDLLCRMPDEHVKIWPKAA